MISQFKFHADAYAASGVISSPTPHTIEVQAAATLPVTGGTSTARVENFAYEGQNGKVLTFSSGYTQVLGYYNDADKSWLTSVTSTVENLNILDVVTASKIVARISSKHTGEGEPSILLVGSHFENLMIAGHPVQLNLAIDAIDRCDTYSALANAYQSDEQFRALFSRIALPGLGAGPGSKTVPMSKDGMIGCTLVDGIQCPSSTSIGQHNTAISIPQFGVIHLAELLVQSGERRLTMLRVELGTPPSGTISAGGGGSNGRGY